MGSKRKALLLTPLALAMMASFGAGAAGANKIELQGASDNTPVVQTIQLTADIAPDKSVQRLSAGSQAVQQYGPLKASDTLWRIASKYRPDNSVTIYQTMMAIYLANPNAFLDNNLNHLVEGAMLDIPPKSVISSISAAQAKRRAEGDDVRWEELRVTSKPAKTQTAPAKAETVKSAETPTESVAEPEPKTEPKVEPKAVPAPEPETTTAAVTAAQVVISPEPGESPEPPAVENPEPQPDAPVAPENSGAAVLPLDPDTLTELTDQMAGSIEQIEILLSENEEMRIRVATLTRELMALKSQMTDLATQPIAVEPEADTEITEPEPSAGGMPVWVIAALGTVPAVLALGLVWFFMRRKKNEPEPELEESELTAEAQDEIPEPQAPQLAPDLEAEEEPEQMPDLEAEQPPTDFSDFTGLDEAAPDLTAEQGNVIQLDETADEAPTFDDGFNLDDFEPQPELTAEPEPEPEPEPEIPVVDLDADLDELINQNNDFSDPTTDDMFVVDEPEPELDPEPEIEVPEIEAPELEAPELEAAAEPESSEPQASDELTPPDLSEELSLQDEIEEYLSSEFPAEPGVTEEPVVSENAEVTSEPEDINQATESEEPVIDLELDMPDDLFSFEQPQSPAEPGEVDTSDEVAAEEVQDAAPETAEPAAEAEQETPAPVGDRAQALQEEFIELESLLQEAESAESDQDPYDSVTLDVGLNEFMSEEELPESVDSDPAADELATARLDLARAYLEMGDDTSARQALLDVIQRGSESQKIEAQQLLEQIS